MYRVLVADDEPIERMVIYKKLNSYFGDKLEIITAAHGREAIELFEEKKCDIVILDVEMPGVTGLEAAEKIRAIDKQCSIIFLTAFDYFTYAKKAITVKALDYLLKPSSDEELFTVLEEAIRIADMNKKQLNHKTDLVECENPLETMTMDSEKVEQVRINSVKEYALQFINDHYKEDIALQDVAKGMNYCDAYFCKLFKQSVNKSFTTYLSEYRVKKAKELLEDVTINVKEISDKVGYRDSNYFTRVFKRIEGMTPSEYRFIVLGSKISSLAE